MAKIKITQLKGLIGADHNQRNSMRTLGLRKIRQEVIKEDTPEVKGLINKVRHLVKVEEV